MAFEVHPVVALLGPRQCGKTTLAQEYCERAKVPRQNYFDLESPVDLQRIQQPITAFGMLSGLIVIDEIQRIPDLFNVL